MLQSLWRVFSSLFLGAGCQGPAGAPLEDVAQEGPPLPTLADQAAKLPRKLHNKEADPSERRPTILLVVGPAEQFAEVNVSNAGPRPGPVRGREGGERVGRRGGWGLGGFRESRWGNMGALVTLNADEEKKPHTHTHQEVSAGMVQLSIRYSCAISNS